LIYKNGWEFSVTLATLLLTTHTSCFS